MSSPHTNNETLERVALLLEITRLKRRVSELEAITIDPDPGYLKMAPPNAPDIKSVMTILFNDERIYTSQDLDDWNGREGPLNEYVKQRCPERWYQCKSEKSAKGRVSTVRRYLLDRARPMQ
jgi:hypothetical protein